MESTDGLGDIRRAIESCAVVSFDVFDTAVVRPFLAPTDLFRLLNDDFARLCGASVYMRFDELRVEAEQFARENLPRRVEDVTLDCIYECLGENFAVDKQILSELKHREIELEAKFCVPRKIARKIYEDAVNQGKRIVFISDMYLPMEVIVRILEKCEYHDYGAIYLSCEVGLTKHTGRLYGYAVKQEGLHPNQIVHIGDNFHADIQRARERGLRSFHLPRPVDLFMGNSPNYPTGGLFKRIFGVGVGMSDTPQSIERFLGLRCMSALAANRIHDNPFRSWRTDSVFNGDPDFIGYYALGSHCYAVVDWLLRQLMSRPRVTKTIHFIARDCFLLQKVYDVISQGTPGAPKSNYLHVSRKSLLCLTVEDEKNLLDFHSSFIVSSKTPLDIFGLFISVMMEDKIAGFSDWLKSTSYKPDVVFTSLRDFYGFMRRFLAECLDPSLLKENIRTAKLYFQERIKEGDVIFDLGYSGRVESILRSALGFTVDSYYLHAITSQVFDRARVSGFTNRQFYDRTPIVTGYLREAIMMEDAPSVIGYALRDRSYGVKETCVPVFESYNDMGNHASNILQESALEFVKDFYEVFKGLHERLVYRSEDASLPFEYYLHFADESDYGIFTGARFENDMAERGTAFLLERWRMDRVRLRKGAMPDELHDLYVDGLFVRFYRLVNKLLPDNSARRTAVKNIVSFLVNKK